MQLRLLVLVALLGACAGVGERVDTSKIIPVEDIYVKNAPPPPPPPKVLSRLSLLDSLPSSGSCNVKRYAANADAGREITYMTASPAATYVVEVGKPPRQFLPLSLDMTTTRIQDGVTERENVFVGFSDNGRVSVGTRRYMSYGKDTINDRAMLAFGDSAIVLDYVRRILAKCGG